MPVPRVRRREERVDYIVVERTEKKQAQEEDGSRITSKLTPSTTINQPSGLVQPGPTFLQIRDDDKDSNNGKPPLWTLSITGAQATGGVALAANANEPTATVWVAVPPPPDSDHGGKGDRDGGGHKGGISQTTEHLLIAAGSIGATIIIVMVVLAILHIRKRGLTLAQAIKQGKDQVTRQGPPPPSKYQGDWDAKQSFSTDNSGLRNNTVTPPPVAVALDRSDSYNLQSQRNLPADTQGTPFVLEAAPPPRRNNSQRSDPSAVPSSQVLSPSELRRTVSTRNPPSASDDASELVHADVQPEHPPPPSPLPPPPTFKQFLNNRPSISAKAGFGGMMSRFSWTNSNAPQTPHETNRDTYQPGRESYMTSRSSVPRFRTVDSWVNQQTNRIEAQKLKDQFRLTSTSTAYSGDEENDNVPEVPAMPKNVEQLRQSSTPMSTSLPHQAPATPPLPTGITGLPGKNVKHERHDTRTTVETAPIFKQHPGTEVRFSARSAVPSEILDRGRDPSVLS